jgi:hypothetical protein
VENLCDERLPANDEMIGVAKTPLQKLSIQKHRLSILASFKLFHLCTIDE